MARKKISELPLDNAVIGTDVVPIVSDGATKRVQLSTLGTYFATIGGQPDAHASTHGAAGSDPVTIAASQLSGGSLPADAALAFSDATYNTSIAGAGVTVELTADPDIYSAVDPGSLSAHNGAGYASLNPSSVYFSNGTSLAVGTFDNAHSGANGISLVCAVGYELNWQAGYLRAVNGNGTTRNIWVESPLEFPGEGTDNVQIDATGITFADGTTQTVAFTGDASALTSGTLSVDRLADSSITTAKLNNRAVTSDKVALNLEFQTLNLRNGADVNPFVLTVVAFGIQSNVFVISKLGEVTAGQWKADAVAVAYGGTGATTAAGARTNLGLGTAAVAAATDFAAASHAHAWSDITSGVPSTFTPSAHNHAASEITSGTLDAARLPATTVTAGAYGGASSVATFTVDSAGRLTAAGSTAIAISAGAVSGLGGAATLNVGTTSGTVAAGDDSRLSDTRVPTDGSVTTAKIADGAVTAAKIAAGQSVSFNAVLSNAYTMAPGGTGITIQGGSSPIRILGTLGGSLFIVNSSGVVTTGQWQGTAVAIAYGGTGATTQAGARTNLGLGSLATQSTVAWSTDITGIPSTFTPSAHKASHATGGSDALTASDIGAAAASHAHAWSDITSGVPSTFTPSAHNHAASEITSGTLDAARLPVGTGSTQVAAGDHTHSQLHDRSHAITSSSDHTATAWRAFYSNGSGVITELALGASGTVLTSGGASAAPTFGNVAYANVANPTVTSPSQITANQNDYASFARGINRFTTNAARDITGMVAGSDGEVRVLCNTGTTAANTLTIKDESSSSTAANRFSVPWNGDCIIPAEGSVVVFYDGTSSRWRVV